MSHFYRVSYRTIVGNNTMEIYPTYIVLLLCRKNYVWHSAVSGSSGSQPVCCCCCCLAWFERSRQFACDCITTRSWSIQQTANRYQGNIHTKSTTSGEFSKLLFVHSVVKHLHHWKSLKFDGILSNINTCIVSLEEVGVSICGLWPQSTIARCHSLNLPRLAHCCVQRHSSGP